jgi:hypothetical protein
MTAAFYMPLNYPNDPLDPGADYLQIRLDVVYALARGATPHDVIEAFLQCSSRDDFDDFLADHLCPTKDGSGE